MEMITDKFITRKRKKKKTQITDIRNETVCHYIHCRHLKYREHYKQLYTYKFDNLEEIDYFLEKHNVTQFTQYETDNMNSPITIKEVGFIIEKNPEKKFLVPEGFTENFYQIFKEELKPVIQNFFQKTEEENFPIHFMKLILL